MDFPRQEIKSNARAAFKSQYGDCVGAFFLGSLIVGAIMSVGYVPSFVEIIINSTSSYYTSEYVGFGSVIFMYVLIFLGSIISAGISYMSYNIYNGKKAELGDIFAGFKDGRFWHVLGGLFLMTLKITLWSLLLIIPGIIKAYEYFMVPYILIDRPDISVKDAFKYSRYLTDGYKFNIFVLQLSFIGWDILSCFTFGILNILYVGPYQNIALSGAYDFLKRIRMAGAETYINGYDAAVEDDIFDE